jgi:ketosteroid isomerase-like protein
MPRIVESLRIARRFVEAINRQSVEEITRLMSDDHLFVDSGGMRVQGREKMKAGWQGYFRMVPDYSITIEETFVKGSVVVLLGTAQGTYTAGGPLDAENRWQTPAAWKAVIRAGLVSEWRVYADLEPLRLVIERRRSAT